MASAHTSPMQVPTMHTHRSPTKTQIQPRPAQAYAPSERHSPSILPRLPTSALNTQQRPPASQKLQLHTATSAQCQQCITQRPQMPNSRVHTSQQFTCPILPVASLVSNSTGAALPCAHVVWQNLGLLGSTATTVYSLLSTSEATSSNRQSGVHAPPEVCRVCGHTKPCTARTAQRTRAFRTGHHPASHRL